jgi:rubrerythrin
MRFLVDQDFFRGAVSHKGFQDLPDMRAFDSARQLAIGKRTGTSFAELPEDWHCPVCGAGKKMFKKLG